MKVSVSYAKNLGVKATKNKKRLQKLSSKFSFSKSLSRQISEAKNINPQPNDPPPYHECVCEKENTDESNKSPQIVSEIEDLLNEKAVVIHEEKKSDSVQVTEFAISKKDMLDDEETETTSTQRGRPREMLYRSQLNDVLEKKRQESQAIQKPFKSLNRTKRDFAHYPLIRRSHAFVEELYEVFQIIQVCLWAILAWLILWSVIYNGHYLL